MVMVPVSPDAPTPSRVPPLLNVMLFTAVTPFISRVVPLLIVVVPVPNPAALVISRVPSLMVTPPENVSAPCNSTRPVLVAVPIAKASPLPEMTPDRIIVPPLAASTAWLPSSPRLTAMVCVFVASSVIAPSRVIESVPVISNAPAPELNVMAAAVRLVTSTMLFNWLLPPNVKVSELKLPGAPVPPQFAELFQSPFAVLPPFQVKVPACVCCE